MPVDAKGGGRLLGEFRPTSPQEWRAEAQKVLDRPFEEKLVTRTYEGIDLQPIYSQEDLKSLGVTSCFPGAGARVRGRTASGPVPGGWEIAQDLGTTSVAELNRALSADVDRGQTAIAFRIDSGVRPGRDGASGERGPVIGSADDLTTLLDGLNVQRLALHIDAGSSACASAALLAAVVERRGLAVAQLRGSVGLDPLGVLAAEGGYPVPLEAAYEDLAGLADWASRRAPGLSVIGIGTDPYHEAGASAVQELAFALATGAEYLRALGERDLPPARTAPLVQLSFQVGPHFFMELAKLRAARMVWAQLLAAFGVPEALQGVRIRTRTSTVYATALDPYVNALRASTEAFSAVLGGCDSLHVGSFDEAVRSPDEAPSALGRRLARNTQLVLRDEAHLDAVIDPAGGSWLVESLTRAVAERAWALFQQLEGLGGMAAALKAGYVQREVAVVAAERRKNVARRKDVLVGTNAYAATGEPALGPAPRAEAEGQPARSTSSEMRAPVSGRLAGLPARQRFDALLLAAAGGATLEQLEAMLRTGVGARPTVEPLVRIRLATDFEALCRNARAFQIRTGVLPSAALVAMGPPAQHRARAEFSAGFFETAGFTCSVLGPFDAPGAAAEAAAGCPAQVLVLCSTDETYGDLVAPFVEVARRLAPGKALVLAGRPDKQAEAVRSAGLDAFVFLGADAPAVLQGIMKRAGVTP
jgi:methylmalonyl-CoA mutase